MKNFITKIILSFIDILFLIGIFYITIFIRKNLNSFGFPEFNVLMINDFLFVFVIIFSLMYYEKMYHFRYDFWQDTLKIVKSFTIGFLLTMSFLALSKTNMEYSRTFILIYFLFGMLILPPLKRLSKKILFSFSFFKQNVLIVGDKKQVAILENEMKENWYLGQQYDEINYTNVVIIAKGIDTKELNILVEKYLNTHSELFVVPYLENTNFIDSEILEYSNIRLNTIQIENKLLIRKNIFIKNSFDKVISLLILPLFLIIHFIVSIAIKLDSKGSIWFRQKRLGKDDIDFEVYKYRSMYIDGDEILKKYLKNNKDEIRYYEEFHKYKNDPRITKVGKILRATSLDELPQLINVLKGDMSLIGPRPYMISEKIKLQKNKQFILKVKPGITGLWQVSGRNNLTFKERNELEVWYIKNWSLWADFVILFKTIKVVFFKIGAK